MASIFVVLFCVDAGGIVQLRRCKAAGQAREQQLLPAVLVLGKQSAGLMSLLSSHQLCKHFLQHIEALRGVYCTQ